MYRTVVNHTDNTKFFSFRPSSFHVASREFVLPNGRRSSTELLYFFFGQSAGLFGEVLQGVGERVHGCRGAHFGLFQTLYRVFQGLSLVAEPDAYHLPVVVQFLGYFRHFLSGRVRVLLKVAVEDLQRLRGERGPPLALFGRLAADKLSQVLHAGSVAGLSLGHPALQNGLNLLGAFRGDVQLLKPGRI